MEWFIAVVIVAALGVAAVAASGGLGGMAREPVRDIYRQDLPADRPMTAADVHRLRFGITLRGYAMAQVDDVLDRLAREIAERDALIARLREAGDQADPDPASGHPASGHPASGHPASGHPASGHPASGHPESSTGDPAGEVAEPQVAPHEIPVER